MSDLISRSALLKALELSMDYWYKGRTIESYIGEAPAVDAVPVVHGRWVNYRKAVIGLATIWSAECSACGCGQVHKFEKYNYCPNCGAKMNGGNDG